MAHCCPGLRKNSGSTQGGGDRKTKRSAAGYINDSEMVRVLAANFCNIATLKPSGVVLVMPYECNEFKIARPKFSKKRKQVGCWKKDKKGHSLMHSHVMYMVTCMFLQIRYIIFPCWNCRRSPKITEMLKEVACRDVVEMRAGLGRIIKQVACQGWGTSSRSTSGSLEVNLMNSVLQNPMFFQSLA